MALEQYLREKLNSRALLLMTHTVVGYPSLDDNWRMLTCVQEAGIDRVELQLPFSEPIADGPMFIKANQFALDHGMHWDQYFDFATRASKEFDFPILFMGYYNSVFTMGHEAFCDRLSAAGSQGFIIADLPPEDAADLDSYAKSKGLDPILLMTPTNIDKRLEEISKQASGFIYCVARKGVTGKQTDFDQAIVEYMKRCRSVTDLPLALGFGIKSSAQVEKLRGIADIAIIGTACLEVWEDRGEEGYLAFLKELRDVTN